MSKEERAKLVEDKIKTNLYLFLEYMEKYQAPTTDFLEIIVGLQPKLD
jgi:hypothetical protein